MCTAVLVRRRSTAGTHGISTVYLRNMKETKLNNELSTKFLNIALNIIPKSIVYTQCYFVKLTVDNGRLVNGESPRKTNI